jgi:Rrf2 family protein
LRHAGIVRSHRGAEGGFRLAKPAAEITVADVIRAVEGPLASVRGGPPEQTEYGGAAEALPRVWIAVRANLRSVVERVTVADIASGKLPKAVDRLAEDPEAWVTR